jgi:hypothetical protein
MSRFAIVVAGTCKGFVLQRRTEFEGFDSAERSLGLFAHEQAAVDTILNNVTECSTS